MRNTSWNAIQYEGGKAISIWVFWFCGLHFIDLTLLSRYNNSAATYFDQVYRVCGQKKLERKK